MRPAAMRAGMLLWAVLLGCVAATPPGSFTEDAFGLASTVLWSLARALAVYQLLAATVTVASVVFGRRPWRAVALTTPTFVRRWTSAVVATWTLSAVPVVAHADSPTVAVVISDAPQRQHASPADPQRAAPHQRPVATWTVRSGDHLWNIAERVGGRGPVAAVWRQLLELNRDRLVDRGNPDLLLPGQRLLLPDRADPDSARGDGSAARTLPGDDLS